MDSIIKFEDNEEKKEMNLRVIRRSFKDYYVSDYTDVFPCCSVYQSNDKNEWEKCDIFGPLFILSVNNIRFPVIYILNAATFVDPENFQLIFDPARIKINKNDKKIFFELETGQKYCVSAYTANDAQSIYNILSKSFNYSHDPTFKHLLNRFTKH